MRQIDRVSNLVKRVSMELFGLPFGLTVAMDNIYSIDNVGRVYLQVFYYSPCNKTGENEEWKGRKWYLSEYMTDDEIIKTAWVAYQMAVQHEVMETFKIDGVSLFNPHTSYIDILSTSQNEVTRNANNE